MAEIDKVVAAVKKIDWKVIKDQVGYSGFDGISCEIEFGNYSSSISYKVWYPDYGPRNLSTFLEACKTILETAKLDADYFLGLHRTYIIVISPNGSCYVMNNNPLIPKYDTSSLLGYTRN